MERCLIVNADDLGLSDEVNDGVLAAHEHGIVTSASLMVRRPAARRGAAQALEAGLDLGLHVELGEWHFGPDGWRGSGEVPPERLHEELDGQLEAFRQLAGRDPSHLDSHQHVHTREPARQAVVEVAARLGVPLRHFDGRIRYCGDFYGQTEHGDPMPGHISADALVQILDSLPGGVTELCCHPARGRVPVSSYDRERSVELETLCDPRVRARIDEAGIRLSTFSEAVGERVG
jgi:predicted glycoside hydrolase/deacetylase ChbG (UPF0249 family)